MERQAGDRKAVSPLRPFTFLEWLRIGIAGLFLSAGLFILPGRSRLNVAVDRICSGLDAITAELNKDTE